MIPTKKEDIQITSTISGKTIRMGIDEEAMSDIVALLTDLYSDPEAAIIREVSTNALDSHIAAGQTRPIEVQTPTVLSPIYTVQDWGTGLDAEDFENIYALYGRSTKKTTNEQTGSLGLGCKSPLTYTNQFSVIGVKNGLRTSAMISRDEDGIPTIEIVDTSPTDEPNGTKVIIIAKSLNQLERKARQFFRFWPEGTVLLNGKEPERLDTSTALKVNDEALFWEDGQRSTSYVVMCNVAYPIKSEYIEELDLGYSQSVLFYVSAGSVHFTPSREELNYTRRTKETIQGKLDGDGNVIEDGLIQRFNKAIVAAAQADIDAAPTPHEGLRKSVEWRERIPRKHKSGLKFTYRGEEVPVQVDCPGGSPASPVTFEVTSGQKGDGKMSRSTRHRSIHYAMVPNAIWVYGFERGLTPTCKKKLWQWCDEQGIAHPGQFIMSAKRVRSKWIDKNRQVAWQVVDKIRLARKGRDMSFAGRLAGSYDIFESDGNALTPQVMADDFDTDNPIFWAESEDSARRWAFRLKQLDVFDCFTVAIVYPNRVAKFERIFPEAENASKAFSAMFDTYWNFLDQGVKEALVIKREGGSDLKMLIAAQIHDPDLRRAIVAADRDTAREEAILRKFDRTHMVGLLLEWNNPLAKYPLFESNLYRSRLKSDNKLRRHNTIYINAAFKELYANA